jgi:MoxR-like ATPase
MNSQSLPSRLIRSVETTLLGKPEAVRLAVACFLAGGHLLIDDIPGVGKTTLGLALAKALGLKFQRIQFTSDLLPSDLLGISVFNPKSQNFEFKSGPLFHNIVLADEINRSSPKTQSALLEAMQEGQISLDNETRPLPQPFFVIATQNPHEHHGTYPLPESQLDRFMMKINLGYPDPAVEEKILRGESVSAGSGPSVASHEELAQELRRIKSIRVDGSLDGYIVAIAQMTRTSPLVELGLSPRGTLALRHASQAYAAIQDRDYAIPDDIKAVAPSVLGHRLKIRSGQANGAGDRSRDMLIRDLLNQIPVPV